MQIIVNKKLILSKFLNPISKFTDQIILNLTKDSIDSISYSTHDMQSVILYTKLNVKTDITEDNLKLNIGSIKKLINAFNCINEDIIALNIANNSISYNSSTTNFKYHLKEDGTIERPPVSIEKIQQIKFDTQFSINSDKIDEILKASTFSIDSNKFYFYMKDNILFGDLTDKTIANLDSITIQITDKIGGEPLADQVPIKLDIFKIISSIRTDNLTIKINKKGVIMFEIKENDYILQYITSALIK
jgi:hypothetical protein